MCGIAGIISKKYNDKIEKHSSAMAKSLNHRGPDDSDFWIEENKISLIHTRLSIQDVSNNGHQPMHSVSDRYVIAFNGEIYNFKKLRQTLTDAGHTFKGGSDTEVILAYIEKDGLEQSLQKFEGMFAISLWDKKTKKLFLCRDRTGEKPLFYGWHEDFFIWASEIKAFKALEFWNPEINKEIIPQYLKYGYVPTPYSIYKNIYKLLPGSILEVPVDQAHNNKQFSPLSENSNLISPKAYWKFSETIINSQKKLITNYEDVVSGLDDLLCSVISDQMICDVPYGSFLSGGVDSALVTSIMQSLSSTPVNTFTIGFKEKDFNEATFAKAISDHLGTKHHELYISSEDCLDLVTRIPSMMDEPFADSSVLPAYFVSSLAREHVTVSLSGDAGDELFCGYNRYTLTPKIWNRVNKLPLSIRKVAALILELFPPSLIDKVYKLISIFISKNSKNTRVGLKAQKLAELLKLKSIDDVYNMLISYCKNVNSITKLESLDYIQGEEMLKTFSGSSFIEKSMAYDSVTYLLDDNLTKVDRTSMCSSLETRLPLLNHKVIEYAWQIPLKFKLKDNQSKSPLRDVLYNRVPKKLIERPKMGFSVPISEWLRGPLKEWGYNLIFAPERQNNIFNTENIQQLWLQHISGKRDNSASLWSILMFQAWHSDNFK